MEEEEEEENTKQKERHHSDRESKAIESRRLRRVAAARETPTIYKRFEPGRIGEPLCPLELPPRGPPRRGEQFATPW